MERMRLFQETNKNYRQVKQSVPLFVEKEQKFMTDQEIEKMEARQALQKKERIKLEEIQNHMQQVESVLNERSEKAKKEREDLIIQHKQEFLAQKMKLSEMKTHFADIVADENDRLKQKVREDYENKMMIQNQRREYASQVKKPRIDE